MRTRDTFDATDDANIPWDQYHTASGDFFYRCNDLPPGGKCVVLLHAAVSSCVPD